MASQQELEGIIQEVTELVMAHLEQGGAPSTGGARRVVLLLPSASGNGAKLSQLAASLRRQGFVFSLLAPSRIVEGLKLSSLLAGFGAEVQAVEQVDLGACMARLQSRDLLVIGSLSFDFAGRLLAFRDDDPFVRLLASAALAGNPTAILADDLTPQAGASPNRITLEAGRRLRELENMGLALLSLADLPAWCERWAASESTLSRSVGGLLTERDVEEIAASGELRVVLAEGAIVTPLAWGRARELKLEIIRGGQ